MKTEHTPEPWVAIKGGIFDPEVIITTQCRLGESLDEICGMDIEFTGQHGIEQKANARRIVACVNACAGISIESLEAGGIGSILSLGLEEQKRGDMAERERDELLNAIRSYNHTHTHTDNSKEVLKAWLDEVLGEPVAWREFDGEGGYYYHSYQDNETFRDDYIKRNPNPIYKDWVEPLFRKPEVK